MSTQARIPCVRDGQFQRHMIAPFFLFLWGLLAGCDSFLVSVCHFEDRPGCSTTYAGTTDASSPPPDSSMPALLGPLRRFELRATVKLDTNRRFVGLMGSPRQAVFLATNGGRKWWELLTLDLNNSVLSSRTVLAPSCTPPACPAIPASMDFARDRIYRTAADFYHFDYKSTKKLASLSGGLVSGDCELGNLAVRPFVSAQRDAIMVSHSAMGKVCIRYAPGIDGVSSNESHNISAYVIGNLDDINAETDDQESIVFDQSTVFALSRSSGVTGEPLKSALNTALRNDASNMSGNIQAAYIAHINDDNYPDVVVVRGGRFRAISCHGKDQQGSIFEFGLWGQDIAPPIIGETVQYVVIDELTQDSYQDLIVETDKNVYFYRNVAM